MKRICSIEGCDRPARRGPLCGAHDMRQRRGKPMNVPIGTRFHGLSHKDPAYSCWSMMRNRCNNPNAVDWKYYGGRGVKISPEWSSFPKFLADMGPRPSPTHTIERRDVNGNYTPGNCYWATRVRQGRNRRYCILDVESAAALRAEKEAGAKIEDLMASYGVSKTTAYYAASGRTWSKPE